MRLLVIAFGAIATLLVIAQAVGFLQSRDVRTNVHLIENNAIASIRYVQRMEVDVERQRILIDRHIFESDQPRMTEIEARITALATDYAQAARAYSPLAIFDDEAVAWHQLTLDVAALEPRLMSALELSRVNRDVEARDVLAKAEPTYDAVEHDVTQLVAINQLEADRAMKMVTRLETRVLQLRLAFAAVVLILTALLGGWVTRTIRRREYQLEQHAAALENLNRELDAFAGRVAHDLRGPLNTIKLSGSLLADQVPVAPRENHTAAILQRGIGQMERLIEDLLALSRIDSRAIGQTARTEAVAAIIAEDLGPRVKDTGGTLRIDIVPAEVQCSEGLLRQALWNLGENAVKYRRLDTPLAIEIVGRPVENDYELRVRDNGAGMDPDEAHSAFEPFFRGHHTAAVPGTGLGLAIVRRIVDANRGRISLDTVAGRGTTVVILLPQSTRS